MNATVKDVMTNQVVAVRRGATFKEGSPESAALGRDIVRKVRHVAGVVAVRDLLSSPVVAGPLF